MGRKPVRGFSVVTRLFCISILAVACVRAAAAPLSPADRDTIQQQQQQLLEQNQRQRDELERSTPLPRSSAPVVPPTTEGPCFTISRIEVRGATLLSPRDADTIAAPLAESVHGYDPADAGH